MNGHKYTPEQDAWLREHAQLSRAELTARFNEAHGTALTQTAIRRHCIRNGILTGRTGRFEGGNTSWQTGLRGENYWAHFTPETRAAAVERITPKAVYADGEVVAFPSQNGKRRVCITKADGSRTYRCMTGIIWEAGVLNSTNSVKSPTGCRCLNRPKVRCRQWRSSRLKKSRRRYQKSVRATAP